MLYPVILLSLCSLASALPHVSANGQHTLHETYSHSLTLARKIHRDVQNLLPKYTEEQLGSKTVETSNLFMRTLPSCAYNYTEWLSLEEAVRLQQDGWNLQVFGLHIDACCLSEDQADTGAQSHLSGAVELLQLDMRDLRAQINQQLKSLQRPPVSSAGLHFAPSSVCRTQSLWYGRIQGYIVLRDLERCLQKVVRDYTLLASQRQQ